MYEILTQCPLFRGLDAGQIEKILGPGDNFSTAVFSRGEIIAHRDTAYSGLMIILKGRATGRMTYSSGKTVKVDSIETPQLIAPAFLFGGYNRMPIDVVAASEVEIMVLHRGFVFELMQEHTLILSNFIDIISDRANVWSRKIYFLSFRSLKAKAASFLLENTSESNPAVRIPDITQIAEIFAATRSSLLTVLEDMNKKRVIAIQGDMITVLKRDSLKDILK